MFEFSCFSHHSFISHPFGTMPAVLNLIKGICWWFQVSTLNTLEQYKDVILGYLATQPPTPVQIIRQNLVRDYNLIVGYFISYTYFNWYRLRTLERFLTIYASVSTTPPTEQILPPVTLRTRRRAETRDANNILTDSPQRHWRRPQAIAPALLGPPPPPPQLNVPLAGQRHLLAHQPLNPLMNVAHSLGPMDIVHFFLLLWFFLLLAVLIAMPFIGRKKVFKSPLPQIPNSQCVALKVPSNCPLRMILQNQFEYSSLRHMSMPMAKLFGLIELTLSTKHSLLQ